MSYTGSESASFDAYTREYLHIYWYLNGRGTALMPEGAD